MRQIAKQLVIGVVTVNFHVRSIYQQAGGLLTKCCHPLRHRTPPNVRLPHNSGAFPDACNWERQLEHLSCSSCILSRRHHLPLKTDGASEAEYPLLFKENPSVLTAHSQPPYARLVSRKAEIETRPRSTLALEERMGEAFAGTEQLTIVGRHLYTGESAPDFVWITWISQIWPCARSPWLTQRGWCVCSTW